MTDKKTQTVNVTINDQGTLDVDIQLNEMGLRSFNELDTLYFRLQRELKDKDTLTALIKVQLQETFKKHPNVESVRWYQYTPYFDDGDACRFRGPYELWYKFVGEFEHVSSDDYSKEQAEVMEATNKDFTWITGIDTDFFLAMFGDHAEVTITNQLEISVEQYDHD